MAETGRADSQPPRAGAQTPPQILLEDQMCLLDTAAVALHIQQPEGCRRLAYIS
jgi:hypothetical protein